MLFFLLVFCLQVFPQALLLQTGTARQRLNKSVGLGDGVYVSAAATAAHPTFHKAFVLLGHIYPPKTDFPMRFPWSQGEHSCCPSLKLAAPFPAVLPHLRRPYVRPFALGISCVLLGEGEEGWESGLIPPLRSLVLSLGSCFRRPTRGAWWGH